jgi:hypothetical protein
VLIDTDRARRASAWHRCRTGSAYSVSTERRGGVESTEAVAVSGPNPRSHSGRTVLVMEPFVPHRQCPRPHDQCPRELCAVWSGKACVLSGARVDRRLRRRSRPGDVDPTDAIVWIDSSTVFRDRLRRRVTASATGGGVRGANERAIEQRLRASTDTGQCSCRGAVIPAVGWCTYKRTERRSIHVARWSCRLGHPGFRLRACPRAFLVARRVQARRRSDPGLGPVEHRRSDAPVQPRLTRKRGVSRPVR